MESAPITTTKTVHHIDARSMSDIAIDNKRLMDQLKYNHICMTLRKKELQEEKYKNNLQKILTKARRTFAFRIVIDKLDINTQTMAFDTINSLIKSNHGKILKSFTLNNFIYIKINISIKITQDKISIPNGIMMEQINPKDIINFNIK